MQAQPDPSDSLVFECDFDEPPQKVWRALTEPRLLDAWLSDDPARSDRANPDRVDRSPRQAGSSDYEIVSAEPPRLLRYRWRDREDGSGESGAREVHSIVTVELAPGPAGGTHLRLTHGEFRIVAASPATTAACIRPITSARRARTRRTVMLSFSARPYLRRAA